MTERSEAWANRSTLGTTVEASTTGESPSLAKTGLPHGLRTLVREFGVLAAMYGTATTEGTKS
jgi:hypothetical protein